MDLGLSQTTVAQARALYAEEFCHGDVLSPKFFDKINAVTERFHTQDKWIGSHISVSIDVSTNKSFFLPYNLATIVSAIVDNRPGRIRGQTYEYLHDGPGKINADTSIAGTLIDLGWSPISTVFPSDPSTLTIDTASAADYGKTIRILGTKAGGLQVVDADGVPGELVTLDDSVVTSNTYTSIRGIQKGLTRANVVVKHTTDDLTLATLESFMVNPIFRGYRVVDLAAEDILAYSKRKAVPVQFEEDYVFPGNLGALGLGFMSLDFEKTSDLGKAREYMRDAIKILNEEASTYRGGATEMPSFQPWGDGVGGIVRPG